MQAHYQALSRAELLHAGYSRRGLARAIERGEIVRAMRNRYVIATAPPAVHAAVRVGGRLSCLSLLQLLGVFVAENTQLHVHVRRGASRLRAPEAARAPLPPRKGRGFRLHWSPLAQPHEGSSACVGIVDALIHAVGCQPPRHAIATLDSALNRRLIGEVELAQIFRALPARYAALRPLIDGRAESGTETLMRLLARALGCSVEPQVRFDGIGRVDLVIDGWLAVECDSRAFHSEWKQQVADRERDLALAALGYVTFRVTAAQILYQQDKVIAALRGLLASHA